MTVARYIAEFLHKKGVKCIFGIPGNQLNSLLMELDNYNIEFITTRHETGASLMAEAYAKVSQNVGVCVFAPGSGVTNSITGIMEAYNNNTPMLVVSIHQDSVYPIKDYSDLFHGLNHQEILKTVTIARYTVEKKEEIKKSMESVFEKIELERSGPVFIEVNQSVFDDVIDENVKDCVEKENKKEITDLSIIYEMIKSAKYPCIMAGEGVNFAKANSELLELAQDTRMPVFTTTLGKGAISEYELMSLGCMTDKLFNVKEILEIIEKSDLILNIGAKFLQIDTEKWKLKIKVPLIHIDSDEKILNRVYQAKYIASGSIKEILVEINNRLKKDNYKTAWENEIEEANKNKNKEMFVQFIDILQSNLSDRDILVADINIEADDALARFKVKYPWNFLFPGSSLTLGFALPEAIGAKFANPNAKVLMVCGDGGFIMSSPELATIMKYHLPLVMIVINDFAFGTIKYKQERLFGKNVGGEISNPNFRKLAIAYDFNVICIEGIEELDISIKKAFKSKKATLIEITKGK